MSKIAAFLALLALAASCSGMSTRDLIERELKALAKREAAIGKDSAKGASKEDVVSVPMSDFSEVLP